MKTIRLLPALLLVAASAWAQDAEPPSLDSLPEDAAKPVKPKEGSETAKPTDGDVSGAAEATNILLSKALRGLKRREELVVTATIGHSDPQDKPAGAPGAQQPGKPGMRGMVILQNFTARGQAQPFDGEIEAWHDAKGRIVVQSKNELPGFELFTDGTRTIVRTTTTDGSPAPGLAEIKAELIPLLDVVRLTRRILAGNLKPIRDETTGEVIFKGTLPRGTVDPIATKNAIPGVIRFGGMLPKVLRVEAELHVSKDGDLTEAKIKVVHNDPMQEMMRGRGGGMRIQIVGGAGGFQPVPQQDNKKNKKHDIEGKASVYTIHFAREATPTARAKAFKSRVAGLAGG